MEVEDDRDAGQAERQGRKHQEVRQRVDLDQPVPPPPVRTGEREPGAQQEREVLDQVGPQSGALVTLDAEPANVDAFDHLVGRVVRPAQREDVDGPAGGHEGLGLAADARVLLVVGVGDHGDRSGRGGGRALVVGCHERLAAYPNGPERMAGTPVVRCWPNECDGGSASPISRRRRSAGPIGLLREAATEIARRRLIGYLVQADVRKKGADTLLGNLWWVLDPLLQMAVYVVLVSVIFQREQARLPDLHLRRDPALEVVPDHRLRRDHVGHRCAGP